MPVKESAHIPTTQIDTDFEVRSLDKTYDQNPEKSSIWKNLMYIPAGMLFGIILVKSEVISWFRIQEMFRLQSFHMYGVMGSALIVGMISIWCIKRFNVKTIDGEPIQLPPKKFHKGLIFGGLLFGVGWALTGACPGPIFAHLGTGVGVAVLILVSAIVGTWTYGLVREKLPH
jgi:uncharacterized membrane protein YedE/YeeE